MILAVSQYGERFKIPGKHPRKELAEAIGRPAGSLRRVYRDKADGSTVHIGYCTSQTWFTFYQPWERRA